MACRGGRPERSRPSRSLTGAAALRARAHSQPRASEDVPVGAPETPERRHSPKRLRPHVPLPRRLSECGPQVVVLPLETIQPLCLLGTGKAVLCTLVRAAESSSCAGCGPHRAGRSPRGARPRTRARSRAWRLRGSAGSSVSTRTRLPSTSAARSGSTSSPSPHTACASSIVHPAGEHGQQRVEIALIFAQQSVAPIDRRA